MDNSSKKKFGKTLRNALSITLVFLVVCGLGFPLLLNGISAVVFPDQAAGSLATADGEPVGSVNVGQDFTEDYFMKCRPSAYHYNTYTIDEDGKEYYNDGTEYAGLSSGSNNYAPSNPELAKRVEKDIDSFLKDNPGVKKEDIPTDLLTASGSGLDPHITPASAKVQIPAVAKAAGLSEEELEKIVSDNTKGKLFGVFGEETVNVLGVNLDIAKAMGLVSQVQH